MVSFQEIPKRFIPCLIPKQKSHRPSQPKLLDVVPVLVGLVATRRPRHGAAGHTHAAAHREPGEAPKGSTQGDGQAEGEKGWHHLGAVEQSTPALFVFSVCSFCLFFVLAFYVLFFYLF